MPGSKAKKKPKARPKSDPLSLVCILWVMIAVAVLAVLVDALLLSAWGTDPAVPAALPYVSSYDVVATHPHDPSAFTQGLVFSSDGTLYESDGLFGKSAVRSVDVESGNSLIRTPNEHAMFGEGIDVVDDVLVQLTWKNNIINEFELPTLKLKRSLTVQIGAEGWGLAVGNGSALYVTDSTDALFHVQRHKESGEYEVTKKLRIADRALGGKPIHGVNELEMVGGELWGNVYPMYQRKHSECLVRIDPLTGDVLGWVMLNGLLRRQRTEVRRDPMNHPLNGIAYHEPTQRLYVTGKKWDHMYQIRAKPAPDLGTEDVLRRCGLG